MNSTNFGGICFEGYKDWKILSCISKLYWALFPSADMNWSSYLKSICECLLVDTWKSHYISRTFIKKTMKIL